MSKSIIFLGASGAVGSAALETILSFSGIIKILLLGRRNLNIEGHENLEQQIVKVTDAKTYENYIVDFDTAICTLGIGQPSKVKDEDFVKIDKTAVLDFAISCKKNGVKHFQLLSSVGINKSSRSLYLRTKAELVEELETLKFDRLSIFQPSMILTPTNRYGLSQAIVLKVWPLLHFMLQGKAQKYRGIKVEELGKAIANNALTLGSGTEYLHYLQFKSLNSVR
jgi:uncharacterized protein YbjT (DUF2867 family)